MDINWDACASPVSTVILDETTAEDRDNAFRHNHSEVLNSDWRSAVQISALQVSVIGHDAYASCLSTRHRVRTLECVCGFLFTASKKSRNILRIMLILRQLYHKFCCSYD